MANADEPSMNAQAAMRSQEQYESYFLGLTFTLVAAAVSTWHPSRHVIADAIEWIGWCGLLASGFSGLWRFERRADHYRVLALHDEREHYRNYFRRAIESGTKGEVSFLNVTANLPDALAMQEASLKMLEEEIGKRDKKQVRVYLYQRRLFAVGIIALLIGRAVAGAFGDGLLIP